MAEMDAGTYVKRGVEYFEKGDYDRAITEFTEAIKIDPNLVIAKNHLATAYFNRGVTFFQGGNGERAIADLTEAIHFNPNDASIYGALSVIHGSKSEWDKVIEYCKRVILLESSVASHYLACASAYYEKCKEYRKNGNKDKFFEYIDLAIKELHKGLDIDPDDANAQKFLECIEEERKSRSTIYDGIDELKRRGL